MRNKYAARRNCRSRTDLKRPREIEQRISANIHTVANAQIGKAFLKID